jgi:MFS family permease
MRIHVASLVGHLVSPGLSSAIMAETGPWPVLCLSICFYLVAATAFMFVPETLKHSDDETSDDEDESAGFQAHLAHAITRLKDSFSVLKSPSLILLLLTCLVTTPFAASILQFMVQFVSKRYDISLESTGYVQSAYGIGQIVQALVFFPSISRLLLQDSTPRPLRMDNEQERDLVLAKWSFGLCFVGYMVLAFAPTLWMFINGLAVLALGSCFSSLTRSLMSVYVDPEHRSRLFSVVGMVELIGNMYGPPMLAGLFSLGMGLGGGWIGLPYFSIACLSLFVILILLFVRVPKQKEAMPRSPI